MECIEQILVSSTITPIAMFCFWTTTSEGNMHLLMDEGLVHVRGWDVSINGILVSCSVELASQQKVVTIGTIHTLLQHYFKHETSQVANASPATSEPHYMSKRLDVFHFSSKANVGQSK